MYIIVLVSWVAFSDVFLASKQNMRALQIFILTKCWLKFEQKGMGETCFIGDMFFDHCREIAGDLDSWIRVLCSLVLSSMSVTRLSGSLACDIKVKGFQRRPVTNVAKKYWSKTPRKVGHDHLFVVGDPRGLSCNHAARRCGLISEQQTSDYELSASSERIL